MRSPPERAAQPQGTVHGTAVCLDETGVLIRGASGTGKSSLAAALLAQWQRSGRHAALVSDDRVALRPACGALVLAAPPVLNGLLELRAVGIVDAPFQPAACLGLVVDLAPGDAVTRLPEPAATVTLCTCAVPHLVLPERRTGLAVIAVAARLRTDARRCGDLTLPAAPHLAV